MVTKIELEFQDDFLKEAFSLAQKNGYDTVESFLYSYFKDQFYHEDEDFLKQSFLDAENEIKNNKLHSQEKVEKILLN